MLAKINQMLGKLLEFQERGYSIRNSIGQTPIIPREGIYNSDVVILLNFFKGGGVFTMVDKLIFFVFIAICPKHLCPFIILSFEFIV